MTYLLNSFWLVTPAKAPTPNCNPAANKKLLDAVSKTEKHSAVLSGTPARSCEVIYINHMIHARNT